MYTPADFAPAHVALPLLPDSALVFPFVGSKLVVRDADPPSVLTFAEFRDAGLEGDFHYLGTLGTVPCAAVGLADTTAIPEGMVASGLRPLFFRIPEPLLALAARAFQIVDWDRTHRFCGQCGTPTQHKAGERAKECPACGLTAYPRVSPAMMVLVVRKHELLLARAARFAPGMYSALAGFVEPGETIEDCIHREVKEEVGVEVADPVYFGSQSWAFPHSLMIAFTARYAGGELRPDRSEIEDARWFQADALPNAPPSISIARRLIDTTAARLRAEGGR
jgi:NAD+ diphosphatase